MKKYLTLAAIALSLTSFSNTNFRFTDSTAQWNVLTRYLCSAGPCHYYNTLTHEVIGDTLMGGLYYQALNIEKDTSFFNLTALGERVYLRRDASEKIFLRRDIDSLDYLIYDFSKQAGDTFTIESPDFWNVSLCTVDSVDVISLDKLRKRMYVRYNGNPQGDIWIEGIGSVKSHFLQPGNNFIVSDGADYEMLCYSENRKQIFRHAAYTTCVMDSLWSGVAEINSRTFTLSPNPAVNQITVSIEEAYLDNSVFHLFDITGRMILQQPLTAPTNHIELSGVSRGMHLYNVSSGKENVGTGKLLVE
ncbi:MAG: T9SS type A sorting domain-containing protein [Bacteroidota bacterium]